MAIGWNLKDLITRQIVLLFIIVLVAGSFLGYTAFKSVTSRVELTIDGVTHDYLTSCSTIRAFLAEKRIITTEKDLINPSLDSKIIKGFENHINIKRLFQ